MTAAARLGAGVAISIVGSILLVAGARARWYAEVRSGRPVEIPGLGTTSLPSHVTEHTAASVSAWLPALAFATLALTLLCILVGPRARRVLLACAGVAAVASLAFTAAASPPRASGSLVRGPGRPLSAAGAAVAAVGVAVALPVAGRVRRVGMPEQPPAQ